MRPELELESRKAPLTADPLSSNALEAASPPQFYMPYFLGEWRSAYLVVHVQGEPAALVQTLTRQILAADPNAVATEVRPMETLVADSTAQARFRTTLLAAFSGLALLLAAAGIYGVVSCIVQQRTAEIGMRMALGARNSDIFLMVLGRGAVLTGSGLSAGIGAAIMLRRLIAGLLFETRPSDPVVLSGALAVLLLAGLGACWIPARRGSRMDPSVALRHDV